MNSQCFICYKQNRKMYSISDKINNTTYTEMISSLTFIQIHKLEIETVFICKTCSVKLIDAYNLKNTIERSQLLRLTACNKNRIVFKDSTDIFEQVNNLGIKTCKLEPLNIDYKYEVNIQGESRLYGDTTVKVIKSPVDEDTSLACSTRNQTLNNFDDDNPSDNKNSFEDDGGDDMGLDSYKYESDFENKVFREYKKEYKQSSKTSRAERYKNRQKKKNSFGYEELLVLQELGVKPRIRKKYNTKKTILKLTTPLIPVHIDGLKVLPNSKPKDLTAAKKKHEQAKRICPHCGILTQSLKSHLIIHSERKKNYKCDLCSKTFYYRNGLIQHMLTHSGVRNFKCSQCMAKFFTKSRLQFHLTTHTEGKSYVCNFCGASFKWKSGYHRHMKSHGSLRNFTCDVCPKQFHTKSALQAHLNVHTGVKPFNCKLCNQPYAHKREFNKHCLKKHGVFCQKRSIYVLDEEVMMKERALMKEINLRIQGVMNDGGDWNPLVDDHTGKAFPLVVEAIKSGHITVHL